MANAVEAQKISDLCAAAYAGDIRRLQAALSSGAEVNGYDATGMTALTRASIAGHEHIVTELISAKADVSRHDSSGDTPLHYAAYCGFEGIARLLCDAGAHLNALGSDGASPLAVAEEQQCPGVAALLRAREARLIRGTGDAAGEGGGGGAASPTRVKLTTSTGFPSSLPVGLVAQLQAEEEAASFNKLRDLLCAKAFEADVRACHELLTVGGVDVNVVNGDGSAPLHKAAAVGSLPCIVLLLGHGADANRTDGGGFTPLHYAAFRGNTEAVHALLTAGCHKEAMNKEGFTAEGVARSQGHWAVARLLNGSWTRLPGMDFDYGVAREGPVQLRRSDSSLLVSLFPWKSKYAVLSRSFKALFCWSGGAQGATSAILKIPSSDFQGVEKSITNPCVVELKLKTAGRSKLDVCLSSPDVASAWMQGFQSLISSAELDAEAKKMELVRELLADGEARKNLKKMRRDDRKQRESFLIGAAQKKVAMTDLEAALFVQRAIRGHRIRRMVKNWVKFVAEDGDVYYFNVQTKESSWEAPWEKVRGLSGGGGKTTAPPQGAPANAPGT